MVEDSESLAVQLCLVSDSGTLTFPIEISIRTIASEPRPSPFTAVFADLAIEGVMCGTHAQI